jgi:hypothetical protein
MDQWQERLRDYDEDDNDDDDDDIGYVLLGKQTKQSDVDRRQYFRLDLPQRLADGHPDIPQRRADGHPNIPHRRADGHTA